MIGISISLWAAAIAGGLHPSPGAALLAWDDDTTNNVLIQWDDENGNPQYLEWDI